MIEFENYNHVPSYFDGICKIKINNSINYFEKGKLHKEDGPAVERLDGGLHYFYKDKEYHYYLFNKINIETWKEIVKELKYLESLEIFK